MLEKTLALIEAIPSGTYVRGDELCFDESEVDALGKMLQRLVYGPSQIRQRLQQLGVSIVPAHRHSEIPTIESLTASFEGNGVETYDKIFLKSAMLDAVKIMTRYAEEFNPSTEKSGDGEFYWKNPMFSYSDAMAYYCFIRQRKPATIVEIGAGYHTLVANMAIAINGMGRIICIDENPPDFVTKINAVSEVIQRPTIELHSSFFNANITNNDILFVDSSHTVKHNSDCVHIYLKILPEIHSNVLVQVHDIFLPRTLSLEMMRDKQLHWTEQYLLYAYILENKRIKVRFSSSYNSIHHRAALDDMMHGRFGSGGGSIWFDQLKP